MTIILNFTLGSANIPASSLIDRASTLLQDESNVRWTRPELLSWLNDAQRQIAEIKPNSSSRVAPVRLQAGSYQRLPDDGWLLLSITRNLGANGATPGPAIPLVAHKLLDAYDLNWHAALPTDPVQNYVYLPQDNNTFYVYPPSTGNNYIELIYSRVPVDLVEETQNIDLPAVFQSIMLDYMLYRAMSKDAEYAPGQALAAAYYASFKDALDAKDTAELQNNTNLSTTTMNPTIRGSAA